MDMSIKIILGIASLSSLLLISNVTQAAIVTWTFTGTIDALGGVNSEPVPGINIGDAVTGTVIYDTNTTPEPDTSEYTEYELTPTGGLFTIEVSGLTFTHSSAIEGSILGAGVRNDRSGRGDSVSIQSENTIEVNRLEIFIKDLISPFDLLSDESLPTYLDLSKAEGGGNYGHIQTQGYLGTAPFQSATFSVDTLSTSVVPVPTALWLFGSGLIGLVGLARRKPA